MQYTVSRVRDNLMCACGAVYVCVYVCVRVCVRVRVCVCVCLWLWLWLWLLAALAAAKLYGDLVRTYTEHAHEQWISDKCPETAKEWKCTIINLTACLSECKLSN